MLLDSLKTMNSSSLMNFIIGIITTYMLAFASGII